MASEFEMYHGYTVCFYVEAVADHPTADLGAFSRIIGNAPPESVLNFVVPAPGHCEALPRVWVGDVVAARGSSNEQFEVRAVVPERFSAEALLDAIAAELEPHGWGIAQYPKGAIAKQEEARRSVRPASGILGKPIY